MADKVRNQLSTGIAGDGKRLKPYAGAAYARRKNRMNSAPGLGNPDLKVKGTLHAGITVSTTGNGYKTESTAAYAKYMEARDGSRIYEQTDANKVDTANRLLRPHILQDLSRITGLRIARR